MTTIMPYTISATELQRNYKKAMQKIKRIKKPVVILTNNQPTAIITDYETYTTDPYGMFADNQITDKDIKEVTRSWSTIVNEYKVRH